MNSKKIDLKELLKEKKKIALGGHVRPDGDCIGSVMGLYLYLKQEYPHIQTDVYLEKIPETFRLIKGTDEVRSEVNNNETPYDLFICLDCADPMRLGFSSSVFENAKETVCIDHHISNESFADLNYIVPDASSTSELVVTLLDEEKISKEQRRLKRIFADLEEGKKKLVIPLIEKAAFMSIELDELQETIEKNGWISEYQNGANQHGTKRSPEADTYIALSKNYAAIIKQLVELVPAQKRKKSKLEALRDE